MPKTSLGFHSQGPFLPGRTHKLALTTFPVTPRDLEKVPTRGPSTIINKDRHQSPTNTPDLSITHLQISIGSFFSWIRKITHSVEVYYGPRRHSYNSMRTFYCFTMKNWLTWKWKNSSKFTSDFWTLYPDSVALEPYSSPHQAAPHLYFHPRFLLTSWSPKGTVPTIQPRECVIREPNSKQTYILLQKLMSTNVLHWWNMAFVI